RYENNCRGVAELFQRVPGFLIEIAGRRAWVLTLRTGRGRILWIHQRPRHPRFLRHLLDRIEDRHKDKTEKCTRKFAHVTLQIYRPAAACFNCRDPGVLPPSRT